MEQTLFDGALRFRPLVVFLSGWLAATKLRLRGLSEPGRS